MRTSKPPVPWATRCPACQQFELFVKGPVKHQGVDLYWLSCKSCNVVGWPK